MLSERMRVVRYVTIFHYWDYKTVFIDGIIPWADVVVLTLLSIGLLIAGLAVFERKDLAS
jgi:hypothetical protein